MPVYQYECPKCGSLREDIRCVAQRHEGPSCHHCAMRGERVEMKLITSPVKGFVKNPAAKS